MDLTSITDLIHNMENIKSHMFDTYHKKIYTYDTTNYNFVSILQNIYQLDNLSELCKDKIIDKVCSFETDSQKPEIYKFYQSPLFEQFVEEYDKFIKNEMRAIFPNEKFIVYQKSPTYRVHEKNNLSVGEWHRDSQDKYFHYVNIINFYLPFTELTETNTIWMCKNIHDNTNEDIEPILINQNQFTSNYFAHVLHGNKLNTSNKTRLSIDFRIIPGSLYNESDMNNYSSSNRKLKVGDYYSILYF